MMAMDKSVLQDFLSERVGEAKRASSILSDALVVDANEKNENPATQASSASTSEAGKAGEKTEGVNGGADEPAAPRDLLSKRARGAVDDVLSDPDIERLLERAGGFAKGRLLQAEAAARVLKGEEAGGAGEGEEVQGSDGATASVQAREAVVEAGEGGGRSSAVSGSARETPILSGIASDAKEFVAGRFGQAKDGAREVVEAAVEVRRSHRSGEGDSRARENADERGEGRGDESQGATGGSAISPRGGSAKSSGRDQKDRREEGSRRV